MENKSIWFKVTIIFYVIMMTFLILIFVIKSPSETFIINKNRKNYK